MSRKWIGLALLILAILVMVVLILIRYRQREMDFDEITGGRAANAVSVRMEDGTEARPHDYEALCGRRYRRFRGQRGYTARRTFTFFDQEGRELFTITDLGNQGLIEITIEGKSTVYQIQR